MPATLLWVEALDKGDLRNAVPHRDRIVTLAAPFAGDPAEVARTEYRYGGVSWTEKGSILLTENDRASRTTRTWVLNASWGEPRKLWDRRQQDSYGNPGSPLMRPGRGTVLQAGDSIYLAGSGASSEGDRPFLDRLDLRTLKTERVFRSGTTSYETVVGLLDDGAGRVLTRRETRTVPPNYVVRDLRANAEQTVTEFSDPHPELTRAMSDRHVRDLQAPGRRRTERHDLFARRLSEGAASADAPLGLSSGIHRYGLGEPGRRFAEPLHDRELAPRICCFSHRAMRSSMARRCRSSAPGRRPTTVTSQQLVASAEAAIDKAVELGIADRGRIAAGGHSYGAFMTANLLAHSDLFAAGIARSGAYNRTLTPFGFQNERRTFWEVPGVYGRDVAVLPRQTRSTSRCC